MKSFAVKGITFLPDGSAVIEFLLGADFKANGVHMTRTLTVPAAGQYDDEIDDVIKAASELLVDVLEDFNAMEPIDPDDNEDEDE